MPLTKEQFAELDSQGFTPEEIASFEQRRQAEQTPQAPQKTPIEGQNIIGQLANVPGAALRSLIQNPDLSMKQAFAQGAIKPTDVPKFQNLALANPKLNPQTESVAKNFMLGLPASVGGLAADVATDPTALLGMIIGKTPMGGGKTLGGVVGGSKPVQAMGRFMAKNRSLKDVFKFDNALKQATKGKEALDTVRNTLGTAKQLAIQEVANVPAELDWKGNVSQKVVDAIHNPIYGVEFTEEGGVKGTIGNLDKVKEAVGELVRTEKIWEEAPSKELRMVKQFYGRISETMRKAARDVGKPIDKVLDDYGTFMENYRLVNKTLVDTAGQAYGNKIKSAFRFGAEGAYKEAWKNVAKQSPEIRSVMNSMKNRELLQNLLKVSGGLAAVGGGGKFILEKISK